jgi:hypothetical protein
VTRAHRKSRKSTRAAQSVRGGKARPHVLEAFLLGAFLTSYAVAELTSYDFAGIPELSSQSETKTVVAWVG